MKSHFGPLAPCCKPILTFLYVYQEYLISQMKTRRQNYLFFIIIEINQQYKFDFKFIHTYILFNKFHSFFLFCFFASSHCTGPLVYLTILIHGWNWKSQYTNSDQKMFLIVNLKEVQEVGENFQHWEWADTGGDRHQAGVHVFIGHNLLRLDSNQLLQKLVSLVHLIS